MAPVRVTDISYVAAPAGAAAALPPEPIKLNAMEAQWVMVPPLQHLLIFGGEGDDQLPPFDAVLRSLKSSLAATLAKHAPLAGRLHYLADTGDVAILCSTGDDDAGGVKFVAAECDADVNRLAGDEEQDVDTFERLVPELDTSQLPHPLLAVQATRLGGGGVALGLTLHHGVADGRSLWAFVGAWAAACRGDRAPPAPPVFDRARVRMPGGDELARQVLRKYAPNLPRACLPASIEELKEDRTRFCRRTFTVDAQQVQRLKARISQQLGEAQEQGAPPLRRPPSTFVAVTALAWTCFARCRPFPADDDMVLTLFADVRDRLDPPAGADYFGTCITMCVARLPAREVQLHAERALAAAAAALQGAVQGMAEDPLGGWPGWEFLRIFGELPMDRLVNMSGSPGFRVYEVADFGWGRPARTENVAMNRDGQVALVRARDGEGVQVSVSMLQRAHMDAFSEDYVAAPAPAVPAEPIKLNAMEAQWVAIPQLQHLLLFEGDKKQLPPFDAMLQSLRSSLAATLASHAPLAGKLHHLADTGDVAIRCSADGDEGVKFVAAESDADVRGLARDEDHDVQMFERLVPELDLGLLPAPLLAVQATRLAGGGVALGITAHHAVVDGGSLWRFVEAWAAACRGDTPPAPPPVFDRSRVKLPGGDELARSILRKYLPNLPDATMPWSQQEDHRQFTRRTFTLDTQDMGRLKQRIVRLGEAHGAPLRRPPSRFVAVLALAWTCFVRAKAFAGDENVSLFFFADARDRLDPPAGAEYFGACLTGCLAKLPARELHAEGALAAAASALQGAVRRMVEDPLDSWPGWEFFRLGADDFSDRAINVSGSPSFRAYQVADFGWGRPRRTENVRMNRDGQVALVGARDGEGVQVSVSILQRAQMDAFKAEFLDQLG
ncbi:hypothetical protein U9M48_034012 [Paspalum notatum var. saurae]|uniref:Uncharacterized protein n=1 Tax=Paspalum notatum var. saurae TaxID=547442 RepID=A0AAQ3X7F6_PASNO